MERSVVETRVLPIVVLVLSALAFWTPHPPAWKWMLAVALLLAVVVFVNARSELGQVLARPFTIATTSFILTRMFLPVLVIMAGLAAFLSNGSFLETAIVVAIALAIISMI